jgi:uncharacterized protein (TIRG00374 family)
MTIQVWRLWSLTKVYIQDISFLKMLSTHFISAFYSIALPSASLDIIRSTLLSHKENYSYIWAATLLCRFLGALVLLLFSFYGIFLSKSVELPPAAINVAVSFLMISIILLFLSFSKRLTRPIRLLLSKLLPVKFISIISNIREAVYIYRNQKKALLWLFFQSTLMQLLFLFVISFLIMCVTRKFYFIQVISFIPFIELAANSISITPQGMGIRELLLVVFFKFIQISKEEIGIYIFLSYALSIGTRLLGLIPLSWRFIEKMNSSKKADL